MRGSLQEQLLKSGIASEDQLKKKAPRNKPSKKPNKPKSNKKHSKTNKPPPTKPVISATLGKALRVEIKQLLKLNKLNDKAGEIPYNYVIAGQVKRFYINEKQQAELKAGKMAIVNWNTISYLISNETEIALKKLHPTIEIASVSDSEKTKTEKDSNSPYSDYEIPDDLIW